MTTTTRENARHVCAEACYIDENSSTPDNPYRLTLYIANNGAIGLAADGNGCGNDIDIEDVDGWSDADINSKYRQLDHNVLVRNIDELRAAGFEADADWLHDWQCRTYEAKQAAVDVTLDRMGSEATMEDAEKLVSWLRADGFEGAHICDYHDWTYQDAITDEDWDTAMQAAFA